MKETTIKKYMDLLTYAYENGVSIKKACENNNIAYSTITNLIATLRNMEDLSEVEEDLLNTYNLIVNRITSEIDTSENKSEITVNRDDDGRISSYDVIVYRRDQVPFKATLSREEVEKLYGLYTYYGGNVTARNVASEFPRFTLGEVKKLFRAFGITKDTIWAAPHILEESDVEDLATYRMNLKERAAFKYCDAKLERDFTNQIKKMASEINSLKDKQEIIKSLLDTQEYEKITIKKETHNEFTGIICLSDLHVGAFNVPEGYIDLPEYSEAEINRRLDIVVNSLKDKPWNKVIVLNLGDAIDSFRKMTTSMTHQLPCVMTDKEIAQLYIRIMMRFFNNLTQVFNDVEYYSIGSGNHSGDYGWLCDIALSSNLKELGINCYVSNNEIDNININNVSFIFLHGKAQQTKGQFKGFPLNLNERTQCWFNDFFADTDLDLLDKKVVLKGDLHQFSVNSVSSFDYINCPSIYASSTYIVSNFGYTKWGCAYVEVDINGNYTIGVVKE